MSLVNNPFLIGFTKLLCNKKARGNKKHIPIWYMISHYSPRTTSAISVTSIYAVNHDHCIFRIRIANIQFMVCKISNGTSMGSFGRQQIFV